MNKNWSNSSLIIQVFIFALFTSAFLIFVVQPMFTKLVLPKLGGAPAVWSVGMVVFQALLLAGYFYAHLLTRYTSLRASILIHLIVISFATFALPIGLAEGFGNPPQDGQGVWLLGFYLASIGVPFFALAGNGPLLQAWFSKSGNPHAANPYFLYNASNAGSFIALLAYPVIIEPLFLLSSQTILWSFAFVALIGIIALSGIAVWNRNQDAALSTSLRTTEYSYKTKFCWVLLSFVPSALMIAITAHISTDVASAPFLWVIPLSLFLMSFIVAFREKSFFKLDNIEKRVALYSLPLAVTYSFASFPVYILVFLNITFFFIAATACHQRLYAMRPAPEYLTEFYLYMSLGGVLGGVFAALIAPFVFNTVLEYPVLIVFTVFITTIWGNDRKSDILKTFLPILLFGFLFIILIYYTGFYEFFALKLNYTVQTIALILLCMLTIFAICFAGKKHALAAFLPVIFLYSAILKDDEPIVFLERSFFGVHRIALAESGMFRVLFHGTTIHGAVQVKTATGAPITGRPTPLTYYNPNGTIAQSLYSAPSKSDGRQLGIVGLGTGAHSCNGQPADQWTFFEIDPLVVKIAKNQEYFPFLSECAPNAKINLGDARITLLSQPKQSFDYLLIDAFSSDAIPMHLLTTEAIALYKSVLREDGVLAVHISNRHLELASVVAALAAEAGVPARIKHDQKPDDVLDIVHSSSTVVVLTRSSTALAHLDATPGWTMLEPSGTEPWRDDFSNIVSALWRNYKK
jgi:hypothetical protein